MNQNNYARFLAQAGLTVISVNGIDWFEYSRFLRAAYLPHATPKISVENARTALRQSRCFFARWDSQFGYISDGPWWYLVRKGPYNLQQVSQNSRSKISRGRKRLLARPVTFDEMRSFGMEVCQRAASRYGTNEFTPNQEAFSKKLKAAEMFADTVDFFGVFSGNQLVGFSENHLQDNGVFLESIWYDPAFLGDYSSYLLTHEMLDYYLNHKNADYVSDGCRSLYHETKVQKFFAERFGFIQQSAVLNVVYSSTVQFALSAVFPFYTSSTRFRRYLDGPLFRKLDALILQETIRRDCQSIKGSSG